MFSELSPVIDNNPAPGSQPNFSSRISAVLQLQNHDKDFASKAQPVFNLKIKIQNLTIIIVSQYHIFKSQQERALIQSLCDRRDSDQTWDQ